MSSLLSFRARLAMFALVCAVPLLVSSALQLNRETRRNHEVAVNATSGLAETTRNRIEQDLVAAELLARGLAAMVDHGARAGCGTTLADVLAAAGSRVTNVILVGADGYVQCSGRPMSPLRISVGDRPYILDARARKAPVVSGFVVGRVSGQRNLQVVVPVLDTAGTLSAFIVVGLAADNLLAGIALDPSLQSSLALFDRHGILVSAAPRTQGLALGEPAAGQPVFSRREEAARTAIELEGLDAKTRLSVARPVRFSGETIGWVVSGAAAGPLQAAASERLRRDLGIVIALTAAVVALALLAARPLVLGRYRGVLAVAAQVAAGDHSSRVRIKVTDDLTPVELAVNRMLDAMERDAADLRESENHFRLLFEHNLDGVLETLPDGSVLKANPAACVLLGRAASSLSQLTRDALVDMSDPRLVPLLQERNATGRASGGLRFLRADGTTFETEVASSAYRDLHGREVTCIVFRDVTQRLQAQARLVELNEQLEDRVRQRTRELEQSNADLMAFTYSVSHDLRAPVATIQGFGRAMQERGVVADAAGRHYLERMLVATGRMDALIEGLLELSQINREPLRLAELDISAMALEAVQECRDAGERRAVAVHIESGITGSGDARLVHAVLANLVRNAWKFTRDRADAAIWVESVASPPGEPPVVCVRDNGAGFDPMHATHLFEPFRRLHRDDEFPGLGIGLATVRRIVRRHGGDVWARSAPGEGARFFFTLSPGCAAR